MNKDTRKKIDAVLATRVPARAGTKKAAVRSLRVRLCNGPTISAETNATLTVWRQSGISVGKIIDRLVSFAQQNKFKLL